MIMQTVQDLIPQLGTAQSFSAWQLRGGRGDITVVQMIVTHKPINTTANPYYIGRYSVVSVAQREMCTVLAQNK